MLKNKDNVTIFKIVTACLTYFDLDAMVTKVQTEVTVQVDPVAKEELHFQEQLVHWLVELEVNHKVVETYFLLATMLILLHGQLVHAIMVLQWKQKEN